MKCIVFLAVAIIFASPAVADVSTSLPLFEIVRDGQTSDLRRSLEGRQWSEADLSEALVAAAGLNRPAEAALLLEAGADPNFQMLGLSVIVTATRENSVAVLELLLRNGGNPNLKVMFDWSPLHHAILEGGSRHQALEVLILAGADIDARTSLQVTPLHRAAAFCDGRAVEILLAAGADLTLTEKYDRTAYQRSADANCPGIGGLTPP
jgi:ankyrin repeat protein